MDQKACTKCGKLKPVSEFPVNVTRHDGLQSWCNHCRKVYEFENRDKKTEYQKLYRLKNRARRAAYAANVTRFQKYGITQEHYFDMLKLQRHKCAICLIPDVDAPRGCLFVDHDHETGHIRGLLCDCCNKAIGLLRDDPRIIKRAENYITTAQERLQDISASSLGAA